MFFRTEPFHHKDGSIRTYLEMVFSQPVAGKGREKVIDRLGRLEQLRADGAADRLVAGLARRHSTREPAC
jgi:hypothetical protein